MDKVLPKAGLKFKGTGAKKLLIGTLLILIAGGAGMANLLWDYYQRDNEQILATGTIEATMVDLHAKLSGTLENFTLKAGDQVKKEQLVASLSRKDLLAQKERDELTVIKAEAALSDLLMGAREEEIREIESNVNIAKANYQRTHDDFKRYEALMETGAISRVEYEKAKTALEISRNQVAAAEAKLSLVNAGSRPEQINAAQVEVKRSIAVLKATEAMLDDLKIISPINGTVLSKNYQEGEFVQMGVAVLSIAQQDELWIRVYIPTDDLPYIRLGQKASFTVSGYNKQFQGEVEEIASKGEFTPKTIQTKKERTNVVFGVKIRVMDNEGVLKPGMPADVVFERS